MKEKGGKCGGKGGHYERNGGNEGSVKRKKDVRRVRRDMWKERKVMWRERRKCGGKVIQGRDLLTNTLT